MLYNDTDHFYIINSNNDVYTNDSYNPYFGEINLMRVAIKPYVKSKEMGFRRESK